MADLNNIKEEMNLALDTILLRDLRDLLENDEPITAALVNAITTRLKSDGFQGPIVEGSTAAKVIHTLKLVRERHNDNGKLPPLESMDESA